MVCGTTQHNTAQHGTAQHTAAQHQHRANANANIGAVTKRRGGCKGGCKTVYRRLEQRLEGNVWRVQTGCWALGGRTGEAGRVDRLPPGAFLKYPTFFFSLTTAVKHSPQGPPTANRHPPPTVVQYGFCGFLSRPCLDHEAEGVPVNVRFCWRYAPPPPFPLRTALLPPPPLPPRPSNPRWQLAET